MWVKCLVQCWVQTRAHWISANHCVEEKDGDGGLALPRGLPDIVAGREAGSPEQLECFAFPVTAQLSLAGGDAPSRGRFPVRVSG